VLFTLDVQNGAWKAADRFIRVEAPAMVAAAAAAGGGGADAAALLQRLLGVAPMDSVEAFVAMRFAAMTCFQHSCVPHAVRRQVVQELHAMPLFQLVRQQVQARGLGSSRPPVDSEAALAAAAEAAGGACGGHAGGALPEAPVVASSPGEFLAEKLSMLLMLQPPGAAAAWVDAEQAAAWQKLLDASSVSIIETEVMYVRQQFDHIGAVAAGGVAGGVVAAGGAQAAAGGVPGAAAGSGCCGGGCSKRE
jgi:hypothetical protein